LQSEHTSARVSSVSLDDVTGTISKSMRSFHQIIHCWNSCGSSHYVSWKQRSKFTSIQLPMYFRSSGIIRPCSRSRGYTAREFPFLNFSITMNSIPLSLPSLCGSLRLLMSLFCVFCGFGIGEGLGDSSPNIIVESRCACRQRCGRHDLNCNKLWDCLCAPQNERHHARTDK
jgi:hypothetical protein